MKNARIFCLLTINLVTVVALSQAHKPEERLGWIESEAHPTPGTAPEVIKADIAAGSGYVLIEDSTKKPLKISLGPSVSAPALVGQHMHIYGYPSAPPAKDMFYVLLSAPSPTTVAQQVSESADAQGKKEAEQKKKIDIGAAQKEAARRTGFGPERAYRGWVITHGVATGNTGATAFLEEGTSNIWYAENAKGDMFYISPRAPHHIVVTAKLYTQVEAHDEGLYSHSRLVISNIASEINDGAQPPSNALHYPDDDHRVPSDATTPSK